MTGPAETDKRIEAYVRRVRLALSGLDAESRADIALELEDHIRERLEAGATLDAVLDGLGDARDYARSMRDIHAADAAVNTGRTGDIAAALARAAPANRAAALAGAAALLAWMIAALLAAVAVMKVVDPVHVGVWVAEGVLFIGGIDDPGRAREVLGPWIFPIAVFGLVFAWLITRWLGAWALKPRS